jgi:hypothetical protein
MKTKLLFLVFLVVSLSCGKNNKNASDIEILKNLELTRLKSLVDANIEVARPLHADDFQLITPNGSEVDKQQYLGQIESGILDYKIWDADTICVRMYHNAAVLRYSDKDFQVFMDGKLATSGVLKHTNLYEKRNGQWQIVWSHASGGTEPKTSLLQSANKLQTQPNQTELNQAELMKQFVGTWKNVGKDTIFVWECKSFGNTLELTIKTETKGKVTINAKSLMGYDKENDRLIEAVIDPESPEIYLCPCWFSSKTSFTQILWKDIADPEKADFKWAIEFINSDSFVITQIKNNKKGEPYTYLREK